MPQFALTERRALAQTLRRVGPDAQTLCGEWTAAQLAAHLVLRERSVVEGIGRLPVAALQRRAERVVDELAARAAYPELVDTFERGPSWREVEGPVPVAWLWALPPVNELANLLEYLIHHEDVRRAQPEWRPRALPPDVQRTVWRRLRLVSRVTLRHVPVGLVLRWPGHGELATRRARTGGSRVTVTGDALELALVAFGRLPQAQVAWDGSDDDVAAVRSADISF
ncbi:TIGR03085 family metal-binding protein [uncultured Jatrophihabitans sp.]|uniref:TIGR03085 family metal-binding protein n=1 Tax=uncultured Jatrophihabitans sp. TaxID=1610747 RepID=UPI0035CBD05E